MAMPVSTHRATLRAWVDATLATCSAALLSHAIDIAHAASLIAAVIVSSQDLELLEEEAQHLEGVCGGEREPKVEARATASTRRRG
jgi:CMP-N-acetylneuraminic acid synthetase